MRMSPVKERDYQFLYDLLKERDETINISHKKMPTWEEHVAFCKSDPYPERFIGWNDEKRVGTVYLTKHDEVGIFVKSEYQGMGYGSKMLQWLTERHKDKRLLANINPKNERSKRLFQSFGFQKIQETFEKAPL